MNQPFCIPFTCTPTASVYSMGIPGVKQDFIGPSFNALANVYSGYRRETEEEEEDFISIMEEL